MQSLNCPINETRNLRSVSCLILQLAGEQNLIFKPSRSVNPLLLKSITDFSVEAPWLARIEPTCTNITLF